MKERTFLRELGDWIEAYSLRDDDESVAALTEARRSFVDTAACVLAGLDTPQARSVRAAAVQLGGSNTRGFRGMEIGTAAHAIDFDDYEFPASTHPSAPIVGALLGAVDSDAHTVGDLLHAYVVGYETIVVFGRWLGYGHYERGWHATSTIGVLGAAAAAGFLLGGAEAAMSAIALSASMAAGLKLQFGTDAKAIHAGLAARGGLDAAALAANGVVANMAVFESERGFVDLFSGATTSTEPKQPTLDVDRIAILDDPPARKSWPSCGYTQRPIEAACVLSPELDGRLDEVARIDVSIAEPFFRVASFRQPTSEAQARFSVAYCVAAALTDGYVSPSSFSDESIGRTDIARLEELVVVDAYDAGPDLEDMSPLHPDSVEVHLANGNSVRHVVSDVLGGPKRPLQPQQIVGKYATCGGDTSLAHGVLGCSVDAPAATMVDLFGFPLIPSKEAPNE